MYKYCQHTMTICNHFYLMLYRAIRRVEMPKMLECIKDDLNNLGAWWFFEDFTLIRVEGVLTLPTRLPIHILN